MQHKIQPREIKFRAKSLDTGELVYGGYYSQPDGLKDKNRHIIVYQNSGTGLQTIHEPVDINTLGQYTGVKDVDEQEIYEGDIIRFTWEEDSCWGDEGTYDGYIKFNEGGFQVFYINRQEYTVGEEGGKHGNPKSDDFIAFVRWTDKVNIKVVGNIYENPEKLKN